MVLCSSRVVLVDFQLKTVDRLVMRMCGFVVDLLPRLATR